MAKFCIAMKMSPSEYHKLTLLQYVAFCDAMAEMNEVDE